MTVWKALAETYRGSIAFMIACPVLTLVPVLFEILQHIVEVKIGLYASVAAAKALEHDSWRMGFGMLKVTALALSGYWVVRFLAWRDTARAARIERPAAQLFGVVLAVQLVSAALQLFVLSNDVRVMLGSFVVLTIVSVALHPWFVAAALGSRAIGPRRSVAIMARNIPWSFGFLLVAMLPLMIPHQAFGVLAIVGPKPLLWPILVVDSLLVGWLSTVIVASGFVMATRAAARHGVDLGESGAGAVDAPHAVAAGGALQ
ncbi:hypothetical protein [Sphingomonas sp. PAMC 26621]|uniref:hypothetical protein n=1 Tax=Sphingomonas sp. PAMC 26621 TaxID=1112213 RepID=UPI000289C720|nr:hypothetical protein [Sphingomonas sp. PAMC 26621]